MDGSSSFAAIAEEGGDNMSYEELEKDIRNSNLIQHVQQHEGDCGDPDCELHSPWVIEDAKERAAAIAWYIAGAKTVISDMEEMMQGSLEEKLNSIIDESLASD